MIGWALCADFGKFGGLDGGLRLSPVCLFLFFDRYFE